jgi:hypothetical protein
MSDVLKKKPRSSLFFAEIIGDGAKLAFKLEINALKVICSNKNETLEFDM